MRRATRLLRRLLLVAGITAGAHPARAGEQSLTIGILAPTLRFGSSAERFAYVNDVASSIAAATGVPTGGKAFIRYKDLRSAGVDLAILEGQCVSSGRPGPVLAVALIDGQATVPWALYGRSAVPLRALRQRPLGYVETGCSDTEFLEQALLAGEVPLSFFGARVSASSPGNLVATLDRYRRADAVFLPESAGRDLHLVLRATAVPVPALVQMNPHLPAALVERIQAAVLARSEAHSLGITWAAQPQAIYAQFAARLQRRSKSPLLVNPAAEVLPLRGILQVPPLPLPDEPLARLRRSGDPPFVPIPLDGLTVEE